MYTATTEHPTSRIYRCPACNVRHTIRAEHGLTPRDLTDDWCASGGETTCVACFNGGSGNRGGASWDDEAGGAEYL